MKNFLISSKFCVKIVAGIKLLYLREYSFSETFLIEVGLFMIFTLSLIASKMYVDEIYSRLKGGFCLININLHLDKSNFPFSEF